MKVGLCSICRRESWKHLVALSRERLCDSCFRNRFMKRVRRTVNSLRVLTPTSRLVLGVSGSHESLAMARAIWELEKKYRNVQISFIHVSRWSNMEETNALVRAFGQLGLPLDSLKIVSLKTKRGFYLRELIRERIVAQEKLCRACRSLVSSVLTVEAVKAGANVLVCGDTADELAEEALFLLCTGRHDRLRRIGRKKELSAGRIYRTLPLSHTLRSEAASYVDSYGAKLQYSCAYKGMRSREFSGLLAAVEAKHPGTTFSALSSFLDLAEVLT